MASAHTERRRRDEYLLSTVEAQLPLSVERLRTTLRAVHAQHDLTRRELLSVQRGIRRLHRAGETSSANDFWAAAAQPRAQLLIDRAKLTIDGELDRLSRAALPPADQPTQAGRSVTVSNALDELTSSLRADESINDLGRWWQRRLRRAATMRALPAIMTRIPAEAELVVSCTEMALLDRSPWSHGDRLLSAFELANVEIHAYGRDRIGAALDRLTVRQNPVTVGA